MRRIPILICTFVIALLICFTPSAHADLLDVWGPGWTEFQDSDNPGEAEDWVGGGGFVDPGVGGQHFDAEYLLWKLEGNDLLLGLQTGFDIVTGSYGGYDAGDIALSFDGNAADYEYGLHFQSSEDTVLHTVGSWTPPGTFPASTPYAMLGGLGDSGIEVNWFQEGSDNANGLSYYRMVRLIDIGDWGPFTLDAHWTMSCGNDKISGRVPVPEPSTLLLLGSGLVGLGFVRRRFKR